MRLFRVYNTSTPRSAGPLWCDQAPAARSDLDNISAGPHRRQLHDDMTVIVLALHPPAVRAPAVHHMRTELHQSGPNHLGLWSKRAALQRNGRTHLVFWFYIRRSSPRRAGRQSERRADRRADRRARLHQSAPRALASSSIVSRLRATARAMMRRRAGQDDDILLRTCDAARLGAAEFWLGHVRQLCATNLNTLLE